MVYGKVILLTASLVIYSFVIQMGRICSAAEPWDIQLIAAPGIVSGLTGQVILSAEKDLGTQRLLRFQDTLVEGDLIKTQPGAEVEFLFAKAGLITVQEQSEIALKSRTVLELRNGGCEIAVAGTYLLANESVEVQAPHATIRSHGGLVRVTTRPTHARGERSHDSGIVLASTAQMLRNEQKTETVHVLEGTAQIIPSSPEVPITVLRAGQSLHIREDFKSLPFPNQLNAIDLQLGKHVPAIIQHSHMSPVAERHLIAIQLTRAIDLGRTTRGSGSTNEEIQISRLINAMNTAKDSEGSEGESVSEPPRDKHNDGKTPDDGGDGRPPDKAKATGPSGNPNIFPQDRISLAANQSTNRPDQSMTPMAVIGSMSTALVANVTVISSSQTPSNAAVTPPIVVPPGPGTVPPTDNLPNTQFGTRFRDVLNRQLLNLNTQFANSSR